jgi:hypothetical protein
MSPTRIGFTLKLPERQAEVIVRAARDWDMPVEDVVAIAIESWAAKPLEHPSNPPDTWVDGRNRGEELG